MTQIGFDQMSSLQIHQDSTNPHLYHRVPLGIDWIFT